jgi:hydrogenase expression/formation protein HypC
MCLAVPGKVSEVSGMNARVDYGGGLVRDARLDVLPEVAVGDYVLVHAGYAISRIDEQEAEETLRVIREMGGVGI